MLAGDTFYIYHPLLREMLNANPYGYDFDFLSSKIFIYIFNFNNIAALVDGGYGDWSQYRACSVSCGGGLKTRSRLCDNPEPAFGGKDCSQLGPETESSRCNTHECPGKI